MNDRHESLEPARTIVAGLRGLRATAPAHLAPEVLARVAPTDSYAALESPIGPLFVAYNAKGISAIGRGSDPEAFEEHFRERYGRRVRPASEAPGQLLDTVRRRLSGERDGELRFDLDALSEFERAVLRKALEIPRGEVRSYAWIAREIGRPRAVRAVGSALARNPIPLAIPCHRVVRSDGRIGEYAWGTATKRAVLTSEGLDPDQLEELARAGIHYLASSRDHVFCSTGCRYARRILPRNRVAFRSVEEAAAEGYRPCHHCRPAIPADHAA